MTSRWSSRALVALALSSASACATSPVPITDGHSAEAPPRASVSRLADLRSDAALSALLKTLPHRAHARHLPALVGTRSGGTPSVVNDAGVTPLFDVVIALRSTLRSAGVAPEGFGFEELEQRAASISPLSRYASPGERHARIHALYALEVQAWHLVLEVALELGGVLADDAYLAQLPSQLSRFGVSALEALVPSDRTYSALLNTKRDLEGLIAVSAGEETTLPVDTGWYPTLFGTKKPRILLLRKRLGELGLFAPPVSNLASFDSSMERQILAFQERHGLEPTGRPNVETARALNVPLRERVGEVVDALHQHRHDPYRGVSERLILNIPSYELRRIVGGKVVDVHRVVVGSNQPDIDPFSARRGHINRTPVLHSAITQIVLNPSWNVPRRIKELLLDPLADHDPRRYDDFRLVVGPDGVERAVQLPGPQNALGQVKFVLADSMTTLHASPGRRAFNERQRALSHGDVRVDKAMKLASTLLTEDTPEMTSKRIAQLLRSKNETFVTLNTPVPLQIRYATVDVDAKGQVRFYPDVYNARAEESPEAFRGQGELAEGG